MRRYIGYLLVLVAGVALYDALLGDNPAEPSVVGLLVLVVLVPGAILSRKRPMR